MSRIGKKPIIIPSGVDVAIDGANITVKGPKGQLSRDFGSEVLITKEASVLTVNPANESKVARAMWGTVRMHLANMVQGVTQDFVKQLQIEGIGYRAAIEGKGLVLNMGFSHPVAINAEPGVVFKVEKNIISVSGCDKELVSKVAAQIRRVRPPEPYKGKGIRYVGEKVRKKVGKKAAAGAK
ncbi:MAG: 50S ribosomal protein L6 [Candidatus Nealsonbacteria bacterium DGGOD1a]|jgi:LSU ribosomal protein L6P|nr:MAG: 50S ribosomal protein L6 [Candidatus Nealsonbacteria bacterium DGGOD1a]